MRISKSIVLKAATAFVVAALVSTGTVPSIVPKAERAQAQTNWTVFDNPIYKPPQSWLGGTPNGRHGYTHSENAGRYYENSNYIYTNSSRGDGAYADWKLSSGSLEGKYEIQVYIPSNKSHAAAKTTYEVQECKRRAVGQLTCRIVKTFDPVTQARWSAEWVKLGEYEFRHKSDVVDNRLSLRYATVTPYRGNSHVSADAVRMRRVSGNADSDSTDATSDDTGTTPDQTGTTNTTPPAKISRPTASIGDGSITISWKAPSSESPITGYDIQYWIRYNDGSRSGITSFRTEAASGLNSVVVSGLINGQRYQFQIRAKSRYGAGVWSPPVVGIPKGVPINSHELYIIDEPSLSGIFSAYDKARCAVRIGRPSHCWSRYRPGADTYWYRPKNSVDILRRWSQADDVWGTNGFHVTRLESGKHRRATWNFIDVPGDRYRVQVYIPDIHHYGTKKSRSNENRYQPGALAKYTISYRSTDGKWRTIQKHIDQSKYNNTRGRWVSLADVSVKDGQKVLIRVSSYDDLTRGVQRSIPSGQKIWQANLAVDAARLMPIPPSRYRDSSRVRDAKSWCVTDTIFRIFLDPFVKVLESKLLEMAKDAAVEAALTAIGAAAGPVGTALRSVSAISRVGLHIKRIDRIRDTIEIIKKIVRVVEDIKEKVVDRITAGRELTTIVSRVGDIVVNPGAKESAVTDLTALCERERVWENYYGDRRFWDDVKAAILSFILKVL